MKNQRYSCAAVLYVKLLKLFVDTFQNVSTYIIRATLMDYKLHVYFSLNYKQNLIPLCWLLDNPKRNNDVSIGNLPNTKYYKTVADIKIFAFVKYTLFAIYSEKATFLCGLLREKEWKYFILLNMTAVVSWKFENKNKQFDYKQIGGTRVDK